MGGVLIAWIGHADLRAAEGVEEAGAGPIAQVLASRTFKAVRLLSDHPRETTSRYVEWLKERLKREGAPSIDVTPVSLSGPTQFGEIYERAVAATEQVRQAYGPSLPLTFHLSPGTPAMAAVWIILAKTRFPAELIESSRQHGVRTVSIPLDISADFLPDLLRQPDKELERLSVGLPTDAPEFADIVHRGDAMKRVILRARRVAPRSVTVLIEGETGTGKELLSRAIHQAGPRKGRPFIAVNCGAIPAELVESELFGHEKGAFTGATGQRRGYFEEADGGTLFLDEVGELPKLAQVKLLRALQQGEIVPVGSSRAVAVDVRVIAATNRSLLGEVAAGRFREDLFHRLAVAVLRLPPLRERREDLSLLIDHLLKQVNEEGTEQPGYVQKRLSAGARNLLLHHDWPGNVRELTNTLRRACVWSAGGTLTAEDVRDALLPTAHGGSGDGILERPLGEGLDLPDILASVARHYLGRALDAAHNNKTKAAKLVGLPSYQTFTNWMNRYGVKT